MAQSPICIEVRIENEKALRAFRKAVEVLEQIAEDQPWNTDAAAGLKAIAYAAKHLIGKPVKP